MIRHLLFAGLFFSANFLQADVLKLAVTSSFENSGLADVLLPEIEADLELDVQLLVVGTGQALRLGEAGDVDAILVHSRASEEAFVAEGFGTYRREIMYNDFVLIGPKTDQAQISVTSGAAESMQRIADAQATYVSRGDDSGTHKAELKIWQIAEREPATFGSWYNAVGAGMGAALNTASALNAYIISDRASWLNFKNKGDLKLLFAGDPVLFNQYAYLPVNPVKHPTVQYEMALEIEEWLVSDKAAGLINNFKINGQTLFVFNGQPSR
jgi:tungstate transport system substrate-binding protein